MKKMLICCVTAVLLSGCSQVKSEPIIVEKTGEYDIPYGSSSDNAPLSELPIQEQINAPANYQSTFHTTQGDYFRMEVNADAQIILPDAAAMPVKKLQSATYDKEDYETFKKVMAAELGVTWGDDVSQEFDKDAVYLSSKAMTEDREYSISYSLGSQNSPDYAVSSAMYLSSYIAYNLLDDYRDLPEELQMQSQEQKILHAEKLLEKLGLSDFKLVSQYWITGTRSLPDDSWGKSDYFYTLIFAPAPDGIPVTGIAATVSNKSDNSQTSQLPTDCVTLAYSQDGTLEALYCIGKDTVLEDYPLNSFLLPFSDIALIFESTLTNQGGSYTGTVFNQTISQEVNIRVDQVRLGYMSSYETRGSFRVKTGKMIPVWDFIGSAEITYNQASDGQNVKNGSTVLGQEIYNTPGTSLLTLNALDGSVIEREAFGVARTQ